ncbi:MAG: acyltransferase family protein [Halioglobus sp.]|nr:acyltransferase family protein [Halioglobus sp.]
MALFDKDNDPLGDEDALQLHIKRALAVKPPRGLTTEISYRVIKRLFNPVIVGAERIPRKPCLFVGNHSLFALDGAVITPLFLNELNRFPRGMGDKFLFSNRNIADYLVSNGLVMGHPEVCAALMEDQQDLLVFPGGAYEAVKPASKIYELQWKERYGFVKLAAKHGYTIMPFGLVGPDEFYDHLMEGQDLPDSAVGRLLTRLGLLNEDLRSDILPPIPLGSLGTPFPKPQRCFLGFGKPINLSRYKGKTPAKKTLQTIRGQVSSEIEAQLRQLLVTREQQKGSDSLLRRFLTL